MTRIDDIRGRRDADGCTAHADCLKSDVAYLLSVVSEQAAKLDQARELTTAAVTIHGRLGLRDLLKEQLGPTP